MSLSAIFVSAPEAGHSCSRRVLHISYQLSETRTQLEHAVHGLSAETSLYTFLPEASTLNIESTMGDASSLTTPETQNSAPASH